MRVQVVIPYFQQPSTSDGPGLSKEMQKKLEKQEKRAERRRQKRF